MQILTLFCLFGTISYSQNKNSLAKGQRLLKCAECLAHFNNLLESIKCATETAGLWEPLGCVNMCHTSTCQQAS